MLSLLLLQRLLWALLPKKAYETLDERLTTLELPTILDRIGGEVDKEVSIISSAAEQMANNPFILNAIADPDMTADEETILIDQLKQLKQQFSLNDASVANRKTADYWNQDGFLRRLTLQQDAWFFDFVQSGPERMLNVFTEQNGDVKLFVNFQQLNGLSMAGFSKSLDDMVSLLNGFRIEKTGFVYLMDGEGNIKIHKNSVIMGKQSISDVVGREEAAVLLKKQNFNLSRMDKNGKEIFIASHYIPSMAWFIVTEVPVDEVFESLHGSTQDIIMWIIGIIAVFVSLAIWGAGSITNKINELASRFRELGEGEGDLTHRIEVKGNDEIAELSKGFNSFVEKIHTTVAEVVETGHVLHVTAENVALKATSTRDNSEMQRDQTLQVVTAINQMGSTIHEIASNAASAAQSASDAEESTQNGRQTVIQSRDAIIQLEGDLVQVSKVVEQLAGTTQDIGSILDVIRGISDQTNLLALNAAIEAARAGEHGRGFAVVADEVRQLASRTSVSTDEIQKMIDQLQSEAKNAVDAMEASHAVTARGVKSADTATEVLAGIALSITDISDMNTQVATATEEQSTVVYTINQNIEEINGINELTTATAQELADSSQQLNSLSQRLDQLVGAFKV